MCSSGGGGGQATPLPLSVTGAAPLPVPLPLLPPLPLPPSLCLAGAPGPPVGAHPHLQSLGLPIGLQTQLALPPSAPDPHLVDAIVAELKSQGVFDQFRKECISDVDTKPAYQNLRQRVEGSVSGFLNLQNWSPELNKNQLREKLRKHILDSNFLDQGVERIVDQVVNPKISSVFVPQVEEIFYKYLGLEKPDRSQKVSDWSNSYPLQLDTTADNLLPNDLESVSPESVKSFDNKPADTSNEDVKSPLNANEPIKEEDREEKLENQSEDSINSNEEEFESPAFEPLEPAIKEEGCSKDSHLSGISDLTSHDSNISSNANDAKIINTINKSDAQINSELSQVSSDSNLSGGRTPPTSKQTDEISFQNKFSKQSDSTVVHDENKEPKVESQFKFEKLDDNSVDARESIQEVNEYEMHDKSNTSPCEAKADEVDSVNKIALENFEMAKTRSNLGLAQHRDSVESKTSTDSIKAIGSMDMSLDSNESNSVFVNNSKNESENEKEAVSFENTINPVVVNTEYHNDSSNGSKNDLVKDVICSENKESDNIPKESIKNKDSESKSSSKDIKERDRHSSSSSVRDKDRKDDSRHHSRSSHSRHSSRRDSERHHSSSRDKKDHGGSKSSSRDKHSKSSSTSDRKDKHSSSSSHRSSHKSSRHSDHKHSSSDKSNSHDSKNHKYKSRDSKSDSKSENKDKTGSSESNSHSRNSDKHSEHSGKYSHHSSHRDKSSSKYSRNDKSTKSNGSNSSDDKKNEEKKNKKSKDENCGSSSKHNRTRRSTDRDSNDGSGSSTKTSGAHKTPSSNNHSSTQKSKSSNSDNNSNSNYSGQSDTLKTDLVNITSGKYIKSEFNMFEFGSMNAIKRHNQNEKIVQTVKVEGNKMGENDACIKSPDASSSSPTQLQLSPLVKMSPVKSPEIPNKKPVIHIDSQLQPDKMGEPVFHPASHYEVLKKPKYAKNIHEVMKIIKIRKKIDKMEQKRKQEAIRLLEQQNNVPKNSSQVYSGISGPEVVLACMKQEEIDSYSNLKVPIQDSINEPAIKFCDNTYDSQTVARMKHLEQYITKLEKECEKYDAEKKQLQQSSSNVQNKNGLTPIKKIGNKKMKKAVCFEDTVKFTNVVSEVQEDFCDENFNESYSDQNPSYNDTKNDEYYDKVDLALNTQSQEDILEIILGGEANFEMTTVSFSGELLNEVSQNSKELSHMTEVNDAALKPFKGNRKRPSTSMYDNAKNFENNSKLNHNNNELCSEKKRKVIKKTPLLEKDLTKHNILNCNSPKIKYKNVKELPLKLKIEIHKGEDTKKDTPIGDDSVTKNNEVFQEK